MVIVPIVLIFSIWLQKYMEAGLTVGGVKG